MARTSIFRIEVDLMFAIARVATINRGLLINLEGLPEVLKQGLRKRGGHDLQLR